MSFSDAVSQVDQILQWQQQLTDPAAAASSLTAAAASETGSSSTTSSSSSAFADALAQAQTSLNPSGAAAALTAGSGDNELLGTSLTGGVSTSGSSASAVAPARVQAMVQEADSLVGKPYVWGGGHDGWGQQTGYDCSGFVSAVLHAGGYLSSPQDTATLPSAAGIEKGAGQYVTIYDRDEAGVQGHVIIDIAGQFYESGGQAGAWGGGAGVQKIAKPSAAYLASFNDVLHPAGL